MVGVLIRGTQAMSGEAQEGLAIGLSNGRERNLLGN